MEYEWDNDKNLANVQKHKICFDKVAVFNWETATADPWRDIMGVLLSAISLR